MIPAVRDVLFAHRFLRRRFGWEVSPPDEDIIETLVRARVEAQRLADASGGDDLAAFFFACAILSPSLGEDFVLSVILVTRNLAQAAGREPAEHGRALGRDLLLRSREIAGGALTFVAFREWLDVRLPRALPPATGET